MAFGELLAEKKAFLGKMGLGVAEEEGGAVGGVLNQNEAGDEEKGQGDADEAADCFHQE